MTIRLCIQHLLLASTIICLPILNNAAQTADSLNNIYYLRLSNSYHAYLQMEKKGAFPAILVAKKYPLLGDSHKSIIQIKKLLFACGDLSINDKSALFSVPLKMAIQHFQQRMGLAQTGKLNAATVQAMKVPIGARLKQMYTNLERLKWMSPFLKSNYLLINIPEYKLHIVENNQSVYEANVVVGKAATQTEIFKDTVSEVVFNPYWNIPASIVTTEILPKMQKDSNYLLQNDLEVVSASPMVIRQKPSSNNALGKMKFIFPNSYDIYLHDTPAKELFKSTNRAFSHGCIRLENPIKLALYLLKKNANWSKEKIETVLKSNVETSVSIVPKMAICIIYLTAWANEKNELNFRNDIYQLDKKPIVNHFNQ